MPDPAESPSTVASGARAPSLLPREHGAWGQLAFPLATGLALGRPGAAAVLLAAAVFVAFLGHEPLLVALGHRGARTRDARGGPARHALAAAALGAALLGAAGLWNSGEAVARATLPAATLGALAILATSARLERTTLGELVVASALAACAAPVALAGGAAPAAAWSAAAAWVAAFASATLAVRAVLLRFRTKGEVDRRPLAALAVIGIEGFALVAAEHGVIAWPAVLGVLPVVAAALAVSALPIRPQRLTAVGWSIVGASVATLLALVIGLRAR
jgi:hypothetical protein